MDIIQIIDELEKELVSSKNFLWSKKSLVDIDKCASLVSELKSSLPSAIQEARTILMQKEKMLADAKQESLTMVEDAKTKSEHLISASEIAKQSEKYADEIVDKANRKCEQIFSVTKSNIDKMLKSVETYLDQNLQVVKHNRDELDGVINSIKSSSNLQDENND